MIRADTCNRALANPARTDDDRYQQYKMKWYQKSCEGELVPADKSGVLYFKVEIKESQSNEDGRSIPVIKEPIGYIYASVAGLVIGPLLAFMFGIGIGLSPKIEIVSSLTAAATAAEGILIMTTPASGIPNQEYTVWLVIVPIVGATVMALYLIVRKFFQRPKPLIVTAPSAPLDYTPLSIQKNIRKALLSDDGWTALYFASHLPQGKLQDLGYASVLRHDIRVGSFHGFHRRLSLISDPQVRKALAAKANTPATPIRTPRNKQEAYCVSFVDSYSYDDQDSIGHSNGFDTKKGAQDFAMDCLISGIKNLVREGDTSDTLIQKWNLLGQIILI
ncbi:MAG: hypothetical protein V7750_09925, partial [Sneathiella sp.]